MKFRLEKTVKTVIVSNHEKVIINDIKLMTGPRKAPKTYDERYVDSRTIKCFI